MARMEEDLVFSNLRDKLFTAVVGDVLDKMGWRRQFLPQAIGPLKPDPALRASGALARSANLRSASLHPVVGAAILTMRRASRKVGPFNPSRF